MGDVKFLSAAAVWVGIEGIPWLVLIGCLSGLVFVIALHLSRRPVTMQTHIAFGPHLAVGMFATWMFKTSGVLYLGF
jgi:leader peptidase (prepilin peptidase)/N-methyltransferase